MQGPHLIRKNRLEPHLVRSTGNLLHQNRQVFLTRIILNFSDNFIPFLVVSHVSQNNLMHVISGSFAQVFFQWL